MDYFLLLRGVLIGVTDESVAVAFCLSWENVFFPPLAVSSTFPHS